MISSGRRRSGAPRHPASRALPPRGPPEVRGPPPRRRPLTPPVALRWSRGPGGGSPGAEVPAHHGGRTRMMVRTRRKRSRSRRALRRRTRMIMMMGRWTRIEHRGLAQDGGWRKIEHRGYRDPGYRFDRGSRFDQKSRIEVRSRIEDLGSVRGPGSRFDRGSRMEDRGPRLRCVFGGSRGFWGV